MEMDFITDETSEDEVVMTENYVLDDNVEDYLNFEGERCGICMDVVVDRGVLDCCQHWFCFACIDNWASITSLCPLCQNEFQLITCVPVHDTVGGDKSDEESYPSDDEWFVEGNDNTLSFPSYYIDETAVVCLAEDGCKVRSGSVAIDEDSDMDTSIACDSCDKWYHAYCVGFDPESTSDSSWLCPRCTADEVLQKADRGFPSGSKVASCDQIFFPERALVSIADEGETGPIILHVDALPQSRESSELVVQCSKYSENTLLYSPKSNTLKSEAREVDRNSWGSSSCKNEIELCQSLNKYDHSLNTWPPVQLEMTAENEVHKSSGEFNNMTCGVNLDFGSHMDADMIVEKKCDGTADDPIPRSMEPDGTSKDLLLDTDMVPSEMEVLSPETTTLHAKEIVSETSGAKRKLRSSRHVNDGDIEAKLSPKETENEKNSQSVSLADKPAASVPDDSNEISCDEKEYGSSDIMDIVGEVRSLKQIQQNKVSNRIPKEREGASGFRLKKIMRTTGNDKESSVLVQELRKKIREAVGDKSTEEIGRSLFEPKLLDAFRAALAGSGAENRKPTLDVKAKKSLLQKGKVRESLTKKIYGEGGKRKRAWTRERAVEFWKPRCVQAGRPEKVETLQSVLDLLRDESRLTNKMPRKQEEAKASLLSRLYLADTSVCPRKDDIKPVSSLEAVATPEQKRESCSSGKSSLSLPVRQSDKKSKQHISSPALSVQSLPDGKEMKMSVKGTKAEISSGDGHGKRDCMKKLNPAPVRMKTTTEKVEVIKSGLMRGDKRKWALEVLARKTVSLGNSAEDMEKNNEIFKGYSLLGQLPKDMMPVLAPSCHNKIPVPVRQAQLYRLTEHFLKKTKLQVIRRTAETELAVADAVNIEKQVADRSKSKLVYLNLCSQELLRISDDVNSERAGGAKPCSTSESLSHEGAKEADNCFSDFEVDDVLKKAGLVSDSPPNSPNHYTDENTNGVDSLGKIDDQGPENILEVDSHQEVDIYGDFEYNLEDDDFIGASSLTIFKQQAEPPKIQVLFSSLKSDEQNGILDLPDHVLQDAEALAGSSGRAESKDSEALAGSSGPTESEHAEALAGSSGPSESEHAEALAGSSDPAESEHPEALTGSSCQAMSEHAEGLSGSSCPAMSEHTEGLSGSSCPAECELAEALAGSSGVTESEYKPTEVPCVDVSTEDHVIQNSSVDNNIELSHTECEELYGPDKKPLVEKYPDTVAAIPFKPAANGDCRPNNSGNEIKDKTAKHDKEQSKDIIKKVEAYIKEHIRPFCKSGVITVEQYRWAVGKTTEKVMKYHSKEKNANFLIKEGEKVKKLAGQYVEAATTQVKSKP